MNSLRVNKRNNIRTRQEDIIITKNITADDWNKVLENSKDTNISISQEYYKAISYEHEFVRLMAYEGQEPIAILQGKIYILKKIRLKKLVIGSMSGNGIAIIKSKRKLQDKIYSMFINHIEKEKIDLVEVWSLEKQQFIGHHHNIAHTITLNLEENNEDLWQNLGEKTRNSIKKAQKNGAIIQIESIPELDKYYELYKETSIRGGFSAIEYKYINHSTEILTKEKILKVFIAHVDKEIVSFAYILQYKDKVYYWMGGSNQKSHRIAASDLLHWKVIEWAKNNGYKEYNMWGADPDPHSKSYGVYKFKMGFGGNLIKIYTSQKYLTHLAKILYGSKKYINHHRKQGTSDNFEIKDTSRS